MSHADADPCLLRKFAVVWVDDLLKPSGDGRR